MKRTLLRPMLALLATSVAGAALPAVAAASEGSNRVVEVLGISPDRLDIDKGVIALVIVVIVIAIIGLMVVLASEAVAVARNPVAARRRR